jgi:hypothetical protein
MIISDEKYRHGFGLITQVIRVEPPASVNNDARVTSRRHVAVISGKFQAAEVYEPPFAGKLRYSL